MFLPYILPIILGKTFHYNAQKPGTDIFDHASITAHTHSIPRYTTTSRYSVVNSAKDVQDLLSISGELNLKVLGGLVDVGGKGSYLKDQSNKENSVEILCFVNFETVTETLTSEIVPKPLWDSTPYDLLGTHYVRSITYGGELLASLTFTANNEADLKEIKVQVHAAVGVGGVFSTDFKGSFQSLEKTLSGKAEMKIRYYATVPLHSVPTNIPSFSNLILNFHNHIVGRGNPIRMEVIPLSTLKTGSYAISFIRNGAIESQLTEVTNRYEDILRTQTELERWGETLIPKYTPATREAVGKFGFKVEEIKREFHRAILNLNINSSADPNQFSAAVAMYQGVEKTDVPNKYQLALKTLKLTVDKLFKGIKGEPCKSSDTENPCTVGKYSELPAAARLDSVSVNLRKILDDSERPMHWYTFAGKRRLSTELTSGKATCPGYGKCGTINPIWLAEPHPPTDGQIHRRQACINNGFTCYSNCFEIRVKMCTGFVVYELPSAPMRRSGYCVFDDPSPSRRR